ncbi:MAG: IgGFc-binding protein [Candidatus Symbiothrix sp.]|jgi:hypothetical protein|nr:IgGFc-binding protein [Candidatus Symbiothrix sp.]
MKKTIFLTGLLCLSALLARAQGDILTFEVGTSGGYTNVNSLPTANKIEWNQEGGAQSLRITADFASAGTRKLEVTIPRGLKITEYSAKTGIDIDGNTVKEIYFINSDDALVESSNLLAHDGVNTWVSQTITGYSASNGDGYTNTTRRVYEGKIIYTFYNTCGHIQISILVAPDQELVGRDSVPQPNPHRRALSEDIKVEMTSGSTQLSNHLGVTLAHLPSPYFVTKNEYPNRSVSGVIDGTDPNKGTVPVFITGKAIWLAYASVGYGFYAEEVKINCTYPAGVTFEGFQLVGFTNIDENNSSFSSPHVTVSDNTTNHVVTFTITNCQIAHNASIYCKWTAVIDNSTLHWDDVGRFSYTAVAGNANASTITSGGLINDSHTISLSSTSTTYTDITFMKPQLNLLLLPVNAHRSDLNNLGDYPLDYTIGGFHIYNIGPSVPEKIKYKFEFPASPQVRMVRIPIGPTTSSTYNTDLQVTVTGHTNLGRAFSYSFTLGQYGLIDDTMLGLAANEYLTDMIVQQRTLTAPYTYESTRASSSAAERSVTYIGRFVGGQEGNVKLTITDSLDVTMSSSYASNGTTPLSPPQQAVATDHTTIRWDNVFYNYAGTGDAYHTSAYASGDKGGTFFPGEKIYFQFQAIIGSGSADFFDQNEKVDPDMYIALPAGLNLDTSTIRVRSELGTHGPSWFDVNIVSTQEQIINGVEWTCYKLQVKNRFDILTWESITPDKKVGFSVRFVTNIATNCRAYSAMLPEPIFFYDAGRTGVNQNGSADQPDLNNWTGKGASYYVSSHKTNASTFQIVQRSGLNVYLGIKVAGDPGDYYIYDELPSSIALVTRDLPAEVQLTWENTATEEFVAGTEIYLPVPKKDLVYDHYFNNANLADPVTTEPAPANYTPGWSAFLMSQVSLPLFDTYYGVSTSGATNYSSAGGYSWVPVSMTFYDYPTLLTQYGGDVTAALNAVTMLKFVAYTNIPGAGTGSGGTNPTGSTVFQLDVDEMALLGTRDFWRSYQKGWRDSSGAGSWLYGSVIAAEPAMSGIRGKVFFDSCLDGAMCSDEEYDTGTLGALTGMRAILTGSTMSSPLNIVINSDGSFRSLNSDGQVYYLKVGSYLLTIYNDDYTTRHFTTKTSPIASYHTGAPYPAGEDYWYMDIQQGNISSNHAVATYPFNVSPPDVTTRFVGVGLKLPQNYIAVNPHIRIHILPNDIVIGCGPVASNQTFCSGGVPLVSDLVPNGDGYKWYDSSHTLLTATTPVTAGTYYVTRTVSGIESPETAVTVSIVATPTVNAIANIVGEVGTAISAINFSGTDATSFDWTITGDNIGGIAAGGTGSSIPAFTPTATGTVTITVIPKNGTCAGTPITFTISTDPICHESNTTGTEFYVAFGKNYFADTDPNNNFGIYNDPYLAVDVSAKVNTNVTFTYTADPGTPIFQSVSAGTTYRFLPDTAKVYPRDTIYTASDLNKTLKITSDQPISVYAFNTAQSTTDATIVLPTSAWGKSYFTVSYSPVKGGEIIGDRKYFYAHQLIVAKENGTTVTVFNADGTVKTAQTLNAGQLYTYIGPKDEDLTGTSIAADKPIGVFSHTRLSNVPENRKYGDIMYEQMQSVERWGRRFLVPNAKQGANDMGNRIRILASQNGTNITYNGATQIATGVASSNFVASGTVLNAKQFIELEMSPVAGQYCVITSDKPVAVCAYMVGGNNLTGDTPPIDKGDPSIAWIPALDQMIADALIQPFMFKVYSDPSFNQTAYSPDYLAYTNFDGAYMEIPSVSDFRSFDVHHHAIVITPTAAKSSTTANGTALSALTDWSSDTWTDDATTGYSFLVHKFVNGTDLGKGFLISNPSGVMVLVYGYTAVESYYYNAGCGTCLRGIYPIYHGPSTMSICSGSIAAFPAAPTGYTYTWSPSTLNNTAPGTYSVTVTDNATGLTQTYQNALTVEVPSAVPAQPSAIVCSSPTVITDGSDNVDYSVTDVPGVTYTWEVVGYALASNPTVFNPIPAYWVSRITSGQGSHKIRTTINTEGATTSSDRWLKIRVTPSTGCGNGTAREGTFSLKHGT